MKILHYLFGVPPVRTGGTITYAFDLMNEQINTGINVVLLKAGKIMNNNHSNIYLKKKKKIGEIEVFDIINPLYISNAYGISEPSKFMTAVSKNIYEEFLKKECIDVIHVHSLMGIHLEFFIAANEKNIPIFFTTHDFFGLCPKIDLLNKNELCNNKLWDECPNCCINAYSLKRLKLEQSKLYNLYCHMDFAINLVKDVKGILRKNRKRVNENEIKSNLELNSEKIIEYKKLKEYYKEIFNRIDFYHFNSVQTKTIFQDHLGVLNGEVISLLNKAVTDKRKIVIPHGDLKIGFLGNSMPHKGYDYLVLNLHKLYESGKKKFILNIYFDDENKPIFVKENKPYSRKEITQIFRSLDVVIVPSICYETFGMVVVEAISNGIPVLVSERVGAKDLIELQDNADYIDLIFTFEENNLFEKITKLYDNRNLIEKISRYLKNMRVDLNFAEHTIKINQKYLEIYQRKREKYESNNKIF